MAPTKKTAKPKAGSAGKTKAAPVKAATPKTEKVPPSKAGKAAAPKAEKAPALKEKKSAAKAAAAKVEGPAAPKAPAKKDAASKKALKQTAQVPAETKAPKPTRVQAAIPTAPVEAPAAKAEAICSIDVPLHVATALQATREGKAIELIFRDADGNPPRTFEPRHLLFDTLSSAWYVWGWDRRYNAERHHRLDQIAEVNLVDGPGRSAQGPYKEGTPPNRLGGWLGGEPIPVKATLLKQWIFAVRQAPPAFPEFKIEDAEEGKATVSFTATDLRAIARWCLQFGDGIQVLEPQRLVDRIKQVGVAWAGKPVAAAPPPAPRPAPLPPRPEPRPEHKSEHRTEHRPEHKPEHRREHSKDREEAPKNAPKVEIRIERL